MNKQDKPLPDDQEALLEDLNLIEDESVEVKGGEHHCGSIMVGMLDGSVR